MIITRLIGGLGNQLFQYAVARYLTEIHKVVLKIDISGFETYKLHRYSLWPFNIQENFASLEEVRALTFRKQGIAESIIRGLLHKQPKRAPTHIQEKHFHFDPDILNLPNSTYLNGYWQSEKYFAKISEIIRQEFTIKTSQTGKNKELAGQIASSESISLHIRRRDYVANPHTSETYENIELDHYFRCAEYINQKVRDPHFFIFSDDPELVERNLKLPYPMTFVTHNKADKNYEDLRLMCQCKHHIIANSTFSWWGAWLNKDPAKIVLAPKRWFKSKGYSVKDLIPDRWIKI